MEVAVAQLLQQRNSLCLLLRLLLRSEGCCRGKAAAVLVPHTRHQLLYVPVAGAGGGVGE